MSYVFHWSVALSRLAGRRLDAHLLGVRGTRVCVSHSASPRKRLTGIGTHVGAMCPIRPDAIWALDFMFDRTIAGRRVKILNVIDESTREALACEVGHPFTADDVVVVLDRIVADRGCAPAFIRVDNGPELAAHAVADWCDERRLQKGPIVYTADVAYQELSPCR